MEIKIFPYKVGSQSAKLLAERLNCSRLRARESKYKGNAPIINWGASKFPSDNKWKSSIIFNPPDKVAVASDKLKTFQKLDGIVKIPPFTTDIDVAKFWIESGKEVMCRSTLKGSGGEGIIIATSVDEVVDAPLYTMYIPKIEEYRVHINTMNQSRIVRKVFPKDSILTPNWKIRNHTNGFVFTTNLSNSKAYTPDLIDIAKAAIQILDLDFGAVDIIYNGKKEEAYVLEVNTAPGIEGDTVDFYGDGFEISARAFSSVRSPQEEEEKIDNNPVQTEGFQVRPIARSFDLNSVISDMTIPSFDFELRTPSRS